MRAGVFLCLAVLASPHALAGAAPKARLANFEREHATNDVRYLANWVVHIRDNHGAEMFAGEEFGLPFVIIDKKEARVYVFDPAGRLRGSARVLLGRGLGDTVIPGIGSRELSSLAPKDRVTPAGRFMSHLGLDTHKEDVLWLDYDGGLAMHRVITTNPKERRLQRLSTSTSHDKRISYGCINLPTKFYEKVVQPTFKGKRGIVYVLPETQSIDKVFSSYDVDQQPSETPY